MEKLFGENIFCEDKVGFMSQCESSLMLQLTVKHLGRGYHSVTLSPHDNRVLLYPLGRFGLLPIIPGYNSFSCHQYAHGIIFVALDSLIFFA